MIEKELEEVREKLNRMIEDEDASQDELLKLSQKLDILIVSLMRKRTFSH